MGAKPLPGVVTSFSVLRQVGTVRCAQGSLLFRSRVVSLLPHPPPPTRGGARRRTSALAGAPPSPPSEAPPPYLHLPIGLRVLVVPPFTTHETHTAPSAVIAYVAAASLPSSPTGAETAVGQDGGVPAGALRGERWRAWLEVNERLDTAIGDDTHSGARYWRRLEREARDAARAAGATEHQTLDLTQLEF